MTRIFNVSNGPLGPMAKLQPKTSQDSDGLYDNLHDDNLEIIYSTLSKINRSLNYKMERKVNVFTCFRFRYRYTKLLKYDHQKILKKTMKILFKTCVINQNKNVRDRNSDIFKALIDFMKEQKSITLKFLYLKGLKEIEEYIPDDRTIIKERFDNYLSRQTKGERFFLKLAIAGQNLLNFKSK